MDDEANRRPLKTRQKAWPRKLAHFCVGCGISPNQMSLASIGAAVLAAISFECSTFVTPFPRAILLFVAAGFIQLRLLSNILDGLMAVEEGKKTPVGVIYNELPDRVADVLFLVAAGFSAGRPELGWSAALLAVSTAYIRAFGASLGLGQDYSGPMAKQHRMFFLTLGSVLAAFAPDQPVLAMTLGIIILGSVITIIRRVYHLFQKLSMQAYD